MVIDTSAIVAIELRETGFESLLAKVNGASALLMGAPTVFETAMVLSSRLKRQALPEILLFLHNARIEIVPFSDMHMRVAVSAHHRFGRGRHPAKLNFGRLPVLRHRLCRRDAFAVHWRRLYSNRYPGRLILIPPGPSVESAVRSFSRNGTPFSIQSGAGAPFK